MPYTYFVLVDWKRQQSTDHSEAAMQLKARGARLRWKAGVSFIYASIDTPIVNFSWGGAIVGDVYFRNGDQLLEDNQLPALSSISAVRDYVLSNCWGDYILVQPLLDSHTLEVTRSPSHACELPCVYSIDDSHAFLTSDITLATDIGIYRRRIDFERVAHHLIYPTLKTSRSALTGISELLPGHTLQLRDGRSSLTKNWNPWKFVSPEMRYEDPKEAASAIKNAVGTVIKAVADRDQAVLLELSGGLDSSIVAACLRLSTARFHCTTVTAALPGADEMDYATAVTGVLGVELLKTELRFEHAAFDFPLQQELVSPSVGPLQYAVDQLMQSSATLVGANSAFSGAGGDTVFGYLTSAAPAADAFRAAGLGAGLRAVRDLSTFHQCTYWKAGRLTLGKILRNNPQYKADLSLLPPRVQPPEPELHPWLMHPPHALPGDVKRIFELSGTQDFRATCPRGLRRPIRMPLLSQPVIETCLRVPSWMWFLGGRNRAVARHAFSDLLPEKVIARKSKGTLTAYLGALHRRRKREITSFLVDGQLNANGLLDAAAVRRLEECTQIPDDSSFMRLFQLCTIENWLRQQARYS